MTISKTITMDEDDYRVIRDAVVQAEEQGIRGVNISSTCGFLIHHALYCLEQDGKDVSSLF